MEWTKWHFCFICLIPTDFHNLIVFSTYQLHQKALWIKSAIDCCARVTTNAHDYWQTERHTDWAALCTIVVSAQWRLVVHKVALCHSVGAQRSSHKPKWTDRQTDRRTLPNVSSPCYAIDKNLPSTESTKHGLRINHRFLRLNWIRHERSRNDQSSRAKTKSVGHL